jgi:catechol 2,3-dioxygenase-like lactoylglutathione lyase family enzyme
MGIGGIVANLPNRKPVLDQINIIVGDFRRSLEFYRRLGVSFPEQSSGATEQFHANSETDEGLSIDLDDPAFGQVWNKGWKGSENLVGRVVVGFKLDSREGVDLVYADLTGAGHRGLQPPYDAFWGARYAVVEDPNGVAVGLMSPSDPAKRHWPPEGWPR